MALFTLRRAALFALAIAPTLFALPAAAAGAPRAETRLAARDDYQPPRLTAPHVQKRIARKRVARPALAKARPSTAKPRYAVAARPSPARAARIAGSSAIRGAGIDRRPTGSISKDGGTATPSPYGWLVTVNAKGVISPKFTGAGSYGFIGYPTLSFRRPGAPVVWSSPDDSISYGVVETERFVIGPLIAYRGGRYSTNAPALRGIHKPRWTLEGGVFADVWLVPELLRARVELRRGFREEDGFVAILGADWVTRVGPWTFAVGPRARIGDGRFMRNQFGVTALDNARNPRFARHRPGGGFYAVGAYGSATYRFNEQWAATLHGGYDRLTAGAATSPIVRQEGSRNQWMLGAIVSYTFGW